MRAEYERRLAERNALALRSEASYRTIGNWRLAVVLAGAGLAVISLWALAVAAAAFLALVIWHEQVARRIAAQRRAASFYERALARLDGRWAGAGPAGDRFRDPAHPCAEDLDLFGYGSVFQLISSARTGVGEETLARWLRQSSPAAAVRERHEAISDLRDRLDLREDLALLGDEVEAGVHRVGLVRWGEADSIEFPRFARPLAVILVCTTAAAFAGYVLQWWAFRWVLIAILLQSAFGLLLRDRVLRVLGSVDAPAHELDILARVLARFEREKFTSRRLAQLRDKLTGSRGAASREIARLHVLVERQDWTLNQMFTPFARLLLWSTQHAMSIEAWRRRSGREIGPWLAAVGELEALSSLAGYASEHPRDVFPEFVDRAPLFDAKGLAHPLLPESTAVRNDVALADELRLLVVSGSNMSGKSTLLRAVGLSAVLAWTGAPVLATSLRISPLAVGASIRLQDSIQKGKSRFYAEITRIRQVVDLAGGDVPLLFLLDEVLSGTNSHDRRIGAEAILRMLVARGAVGLVTTHDLALAQIGEALAPKAANVHFEDHLEDGHIAFDFRMRPGVVTRSNALELMRSVGLPVGAGGSVPD